MQLDYTKINGMVAAVIQDWKSGRVLMVGFMNEEAFQKTVETGCAVFYSRSRNKLWKPTEKHLMEMAAEGLRTLCIAYRVVESRPSRALVPPPSCVCVYGCVCEWVNA